MKKVWIAVALVALVLFAVPLFAPYDPNSQQREASLAAPSAAHWLGTDDFGRDLFSRFLYGGRWSVLVGVGAAALSLAIAWIVGGVAGYYGGWLDSGLMWLADLFLLVPWLYLLIGARAALPLETSQRIAMASLMLLIALVSWARPARLVRGLVLSCRERGYVAAARGFGVPGPVIFVRHILPNTYGLFTTQVLLLVPRYVLAEVTLSFLGAGAVEPNASWGSLILPVKDAYLLSAEWWRAIPALLVALVFALFAIAARRVDRHFEMSR